jgi:hypothetical protein
MFYEQRPSEAWYPSHGLLTMKETIQIVHLDFGIAEDRLLGPYFSFTTSDWGYLQ